MIKKLRVKIEKYLFDKYSEDLIAESYDEKSVKEICQDIGKIQGVEEMLKSILKKDRVRYFNADPSSQGSIKGAFYRTLWLLKMIQQEKDGAKGDKKVVLDNPRLG